MDSETRELVSWAVDRREKVFENVKVHESRASKRRVKMVAKMRTKKGDMKIERRQNEETYLIKGGV